VLADRYVFTAFARSIVRGADPDWIRNVFGCALVPDLTLYLKIDADTLVPRILRTRGIDYWEAGMDMHLGTDLYESFRKYQWRLIREYNRMARDLDFITVDATLGIEEIQARIRRPVQALLDSRRVRALSTSLDRLRPLLFEAEEDDAAGPEAPSSAGGLQVPADLGPGEAPARAARAPGQD